MKFIGQMKGKYIITLPPGFCDQIFKILRQYFLNSAAVFVKFSSNISQSKHPKATQILT